MNNLEILQQIFPHKLFLDKNSQIYDWEGKPMTKKQLIDYIKYMANGIIKSNKEFIERMSKPEKISPYHTSNWISVSNKDGAVNLGLSTQWDNSFKFVDIYPYATCPKVLHYISTGQGKCFYTIMNESGINSIVKWYIDIINETIPELPEPSFYVIFNNKNTCWKVSCHTGAILERPVHNLKYTKNEISNNKHYTPEVNSKIETFFKNCNIEPNTVWLWNEDTSWFMKPKGGYDGCQKGYYELDYQGFVTEDLNFKLSENE